MNTNVFNSPLLLPGLRLKEVNSSDDSGEGTSFSADSTILVCLKNFEENNRVFLGKKPAVMATYTGGVTAFDADGGGDEEGEEEVEEIETENPIEIKTEGKVN